MATTVAERFELIKDEAFQISVHVADPRYPHVGHETRRYLILYGSNTPDKFELLQQVQQRTWTTSFSGSTLSSDSTSVLVSFMKSCAVSA